jgi:hypothetical protein
MYNTGASPPAGTVEMFYNNGIRKPCFVGGDILAKEKKIDIKIIDRKAPRVAIQITEIAVDAKKNAPTAIRRTLDRDESGRRRSKKNHY